MEPYAQILTISTFALYTFIFSLFILPQIKDLRKIRSKLNRLIKSKPVLKKIKNDEERKKQKMDITNILKDYKIRYKDIVNFNPFLVLGVLATIVASFFIFLNYIPDGHTFFSYIKKHEIILIFGSYFIALFILMWVAFLRYIPNFKKISDWEYLVNNFGISPSGLAECANIRLDFNPRDSLLPEEYDVEESYPIKIISDIELRGYKYWFFIYDIDDKKNIYNKFCSVDNSSDMKELHFDMDDFLGWSVDVGEFDFYKFKDKRLRLFLFIFDPLLYGDYGIPYWGFSDFRYLGNVWSSSNKVIVGTSQYPYIRYSGKGLNFKKVVWDLKREERYSQSPSVSEKFQWEIVKEALNKNKNKILK